MKSFFAILLCCIFSVQIIFSQTTIDKEKFFSDTSIINATIITNFSKLFKESKPGTIIPAMFVSKFPDSTEVNEPIQLQPRGHFRHGYCYVPPLKLIFKSQKNSVLYSLKALKLVNQCKLSRDYDQYLIKEFVIYKIYNLLTDMSFRARLLNLTLQDSSGRKKPITIHSFLLEDIKEVAKRNNCKEWAKGGIPTEASDRKQMTMVALFEYMIGNTDWAVSVLHNIKLIVSKEDSTLRPYVVPYDFDYAGLVNTEYAVPDEKLEIEKVTERVYRGFPRTMLELNEALDVFKQKKDQIYQMIDNFNLLATWSKRDLKNYLDGFYDAIKNQKDIKSTFIDNARYH